MSVKKSSIYNMVFNSILLKNCFFFKFFKNFIEKLLIS